jgi:hypothetical protein
LKYDHTLEADGRTNVVAGVAQGFGDILSVRRENRREAKVNQLCEKGFFVCGSFLSKGMDLPINCSLLPQH